MARFFFTTGQSSADDVAQSVASDRRSTVSSPRFNKLALAVADHP